MEMQRAGNPLMIYWNFNLRKENEEVEVFPLEGKPLRLTLITPRGKKEIKDYAVKGSVIEWKFTSDYQKAYGDYSLMLEVLSPSGKVLMTADQCGFARIADKTCFSASAVSSDTITLTSELTVVRIMPVFPEIGPNGNWWVDGVDTGHSSVGTSAYEYALSLGYAGTEEDYAAEMAALPVLNEQSRSATEDARQATEESIAQQVSADNYIKGVKSYVDNVLTPAVSRTTQAAENAEEAAQHATLSAQDAESSASAADAAATRASEAANRANAAAEQAERDVEAAIEAFGPAIAHKADKIKFEGKSYVETDGISTNDFYYSMPDSADGTEDDIIATKSNLKKINGQDLFGKGNIVIEGKNYDNEIATLQQKDAEQAAKLTELSAEMSSFILEDGGLDNNGNDMENSVLCRTNFLPCNNGSILSGYIYRVAQYDENYSYLGQIIPTNEYSYTDSLVISNESCAFVRISVLTHSRTKANLKVDGTSVLYIADSNSILLYRKISKKIESPISTDKLEDGSVTLQKTAFGELGKNLFNKDNYKIGLLANGNIYDTSDTYKAYLTSDYISVVAGENYVYSNEGVAKVLERAEVYDKDKKFLVSVVNQGTLFTIPSNGAFFRFSIKTTTDSTLWQTSQFEKGVIATEYEPYGYKIAESVLPTIANKAHKPYLSNYAETLLGGATLEISNAPNAKTNHTIGCGMSIGTMGRIRISHGRATYAFGVVEIDATNIYEFTSGSFPTPTKTTPHGLMLKDLVRVVVRKDSLYDATIIVTTASGEYTQQITWRGCTDAVMLYAMSGEYNNVSLTIGGNGFKKDIWIYGDSYADYWLPNLYDKEITDFYADAYSGRKSASAYTSFINALKLGTPKTLVWMMGMNDGDNGTINADYKGAFDAVKALCETHGIAFVPCTIPNCSQTHIYKNEYIRANAENYIDMAKILGADSEGSTWYDGLISSDNVHPSNQGKAVIANTLIEYVF